MMASGFGEEGMMVVYLFKNKQLRSVDSLLICWLSRRDDNEAIGKLSPEFAIISGS